MKFIAAAFLFYLFPPPASSAGPDFSGLTPPPGLACSQDYSNLRSGKRLNFRTLRYSCAKGVAVKLEVSWPLEPARAARLRASREAVYAGIISPARLDYLRAEEREVAVRGEDRGRREGDNFIFSADSGFKPVTSMTSKAAYGAAAGLLYCADSGKFFEITVYAPGRAASAAAQLEILGGFRCGR